MKLTNNIIWAQTWDGKYRRVWDTVPEEGDWRKLHEGHGSYWRESDFGSQRRRGRLRSRRKEWKWLWCRENDHTSHRAERFQFGELPVEFSSAAGWKRSVHDPQVQIHWPVAHDNVFSSSLQKGKNEGIAVYVFNKVIFFKELSYALTVFVIPIKDSVSLWAHGVEESNDYIPRGGLYIVGWGERWTRT